MPKSLGHGKAPLLLTSPTQAEQAAEGCVHVGFESLQGWRLHSFSGQHVPAFVQAHRKDFPMSK